MEEFDRYAKEFGELGYVYYHSYRVQKYMEKLCDLFKISGRERELAGIIGLLHDIGKFGNTDLDHGDYGVKLLFEDNLIDKFNIHGDSYELIKKAIKNHNKYEIEDELNARELFFTKLLRDADKIDIFNSYSNLILKLEECDEDISPLVKEDFFNNKVVERGHIKNGNDNIVYIISLLFDINFENSYRVIGEERLIINLFDLLKNRDRFEEYIIYINDYLEEELSRNV